MFICAHWSSSTTMKCVYLTSSSLKTITPTETSLIQCRLPLFLTQIKEKKKLCHRPCGNSVWFFRIAFRNCDCLCFQDIHLLILGVGTVRKKAKKRSNEGNVKKGKDRWSEKDNSTLQHVKPSQHHFLIKSPTEIYWTCGKFHFSVEGPLLSTLVRLPPSWPLISLCLVLGKFCWW